MVDAQQWDGVAGKQVLLTGGTSGIGLAAAEALAARGANVAIVARDRQRGESAAARALAAASAASQQVAVEVLVADLGAQSRSTPPCPRRRCTVREVAGPCQQCGRSFQQSPAHGGRGGTDLGRQPSGTVPPHGAPSRKAARVRAGASHHDELYASEGAQLPFDDLDGSRFYAQGRFVRGFRRYGQTKLANIVFTMELARRLEGTGVSAYCYHPGNVATNFNHNNGPMMSLPMAIIKPFSRSPSRRRGDCCVSLASRPVSPARAAVSSST